MAKLGKQVITGTIWASLDKIGTMALRFVVNLILARLLMPADFGCIGMISIFITVSQTLVDGGFGSALIQKKEPTQEDYSTIFYWNLLFAVILYGILYSCAPLIASFFSIDQLCKIIRVLGLVLIINALIIVQNNRLRKQLAFKTIALINVGSHLFAAIIAIWLAYKNWGVWSLVSMQLMYGIFQNCLLWSCVKWYPSFQFSMQSLRQLFGFGGYLLAANILQSICTNLQGILIGRKFSAVQMGFYSQAKKLDDVCTHALPNVIVQVIFPVYSRFQNDKQKLQDVLGLSARLISYFIFPLMMILILVAEPLIVSLYGEKWLASVPYFRILCLGGIFVCLQSINYYAVAAVGKSNALFGWSIYKWSVLLLSLIIGSHWGIYGILWGMVLGDINIFLTNACLAHKYIGHKLIKQAKDVIPILLISVLSYLSTYFLQLYVYSIHFVLTVLIFTGIYILLSLLCRLSILSDIWNLKKYF